MKEHQVVRVVGVGAILAAYVVRLISVGSGQIAIFGWSIHPFALIAIVIVLLAAPETVDALADAILSSND